MRNSHPRVHGRQHLDRDRPAKDLVAAAPYLPHAPEAIRSINV